MYGVPSTMNTEKLVDSDMTTEESATLNVPLIETHEEEGRQQAHPKPAAVATVPPKDNWDCLYCLSGCLILLAQMRH